MDLFTALGFRQSAASSSSAEAAASTSTSTTSAAYGSISSSSLTTKTSRRLASLSVGSDDDDDGEELTGSRGAGRNLAEGTSSRGGSSSNPQQSQAPPSLLPRGGSCHMLLTDDTLDDRRRYGGSGGRRHREEDDGDVDAVGGGGEGGKDGSSAEFLVAHYLFGAIKGGSSTSSSSSSSSSSASAQATPTHEQGQSTSDSARRKTAAGGSGRKVILVDFAGRGEQHWMAIGKRFGVSRIPADQVTHIVPTLYPRAASSSAMSGYFGSKRSPSLLLAKPANSPESSRSTTGAVAASGVAKSGANDISEVSGSSSKLDEGNTGDSRTTFNLDDRLSLVPTFQAVLDSLETDKTVLVSETHIDQTNGPLVILSGVSSMLLLGMEVDEVERFVRALWAKVRKMSGTLLTHLSLPSLSSSSSPNGMSISSASTDLFLALMRLARVGGGQWISVQGLTTGRNGVVMGEITAQPLSSAGDGHDVYPRIARDRPLQYRIEDNGQVRVFAKGTSEGFL